MILILEKTNYTRFNTIKCARQPGQAVIESQTRPSLPFVD